MKYLMFVLFSCFESFSIPFIGLVLFRTRLNPHTYKNLILIGVSMAVLSFICTIGGIGTITPLVQIIIAIIMIKFLFYRRIFFSILSVISGYLVFAVIQTLLVFLLQYLHLATLSDFEPYTFKGHALQFGTFLLVFILGLQLKVSGHGYSFDPQESFTKKPIKYTNKVFALVISTSMLLLAGIYYEINNTHSYAYLLEAFLFIAILSTTSLIYISLNRDREESYHS
jgi:hypothetical protein